MPFSCVIFVFEILKAIKIRSDIFLDVTSFSLITEICLSRDSYLVNIWP
jgi:hypothetical protein